MENNKLRRGPNPEPEEKITTAGLDQTDREAHQPEPKPPDTLIRRRFVIVPQLGVSTKIVEIMSEVVDDKPDKKGK